MQESKAPEYWIDWPLLASEIAKRKKTLPQLIVAGEFWYSARYICGVCGTNSVVGHWDDCDHFACSASICTPTKRGALVTLANEPLPTLCAFLSVPYPDLVMRTKLRDAEVVLTPFGVHLIHDGPANFAREVSVRYDFATDWIITATQKSVPANTEEALRVDPKDYHLGMRWDALIIDDPSEEDPDHVEIAKIYVGKNRK